MTTATSYWYDPPTVSLSWNDRTFRPGEKQIFSTVVSWSYPNSPPVLSVEFLTTQNEFDWRDNVTLTATATDVDGDAMGLYVSIDGAVGNMQELTDSLTNNVATDFTISFAEWNLSRGAHTFQFYAIDSLGSISLDDIKFSFTTLRPTPTASGSPVPSPSPSIRASPIATASPATSPRPSSTPTASPSLIPGPLVMNLGAYGSLIGNVPSNPDALYSFSAPNGFQGYMNVTGDSQRNRQFGWYVNNWADVGLSPIIHRFAVEASGIVIFAVHNYGTVPREFHAACWMDLMFSGPSPAPNPIPSDDGPLVTSSPEWTGFHVEGLGLDVDYHLRNFPFVTDVTTYWFGERGLYISNVATMTQDLTAHPLDAWCTFSWQNQTVEPQQTRTLSVVVNWGHASARPVLSMLDTHIPEILFWEDPINLTGIITGESPSGSLIALFDGDMLNLHIIRSGIPINEDFTLPIALQTWDIRTGSHTMDISAVDNAGMYSDPIQFKFTCIAPTLAKTATRSDSPTVTSTPTATVSTSISVSQTPTHTPTPSASPYEGLRMSVSADVDSKSNFRLQGIRSWSPANPIDISARGLTTRYIVNGTTGLVTRMEPCTIGGLTIETKVDATGGVAAIQFLIRNELDRSERVSLSLGSDIFIERNRHATISKRANGTGFQIASGLAHFQVFTGHYPMVTDADSYWFGPSPSLERSQWTQVQEPVIDDDDLSFAVSWRDQEVPAQGRLIISMLMSWGDDLEPPTGKLDSTPGPSAALEWEAPTNLTGTVSVNAISVYLLIDGNPVEVVQPAADGKFTLSFVPSALQLAAGTHTFVICVIDSSGAVSAISEFHTEVKAPTAPATQTLPGTRSPTATASVSATWGDLPEAPWLDLAEGEAASSANVAGIIVGVGIPVGAILIVAFSFLLWRYRRAVRADMTQHLRTGSSSQVSAGGTKF
jgi:hypothetical protein